MIGLFSFDGPMYKDKNGIYCNTTLTNELFQRYFTVVDKLIVVIRTFEINITYKEANFKKIDLPNVEFIEIPNLNSAKGILFDYKRAKKIISDQVKKTDLVFARMPSVISDITIQMCRKYKKKYLVEVGGCAWDSYWNHSINGKLVAPLMFLKEKKGIKHADFSIYVTKNWLQNRYPTKGVKTVASNVHLQNIFSKSLKDRIKKIESYKKDHEYIIGTTAAVDVPYKGQQYIIKAIARLNQEGYNFNYELVGKGNPQRLKKLAESLGIKDKVKFKGVLVHEDVFKWLDSIDIYAQPSKQEGLPRAVIEALSRACPAIGSNIAGIPELLKKENVFDEGNVNQICKILKNMVEDNLTKEAIVNFEKSKHFKIDKLTENRNRIYDLYRDSIKI